jgi:ParB family chromosome partitioning protein
MTQLTTDTDDSERRTEHEHEHEHNHENDLSFGDIVIDRECLDSKKRTENNTNTKTETETETETETDKAVVVNVPPVTAKEWDVFDRGTTVAEDNPRYRSDAPVAIVVFMPELDSEFQYYSGVAPLTLTRLNGSGVNWYAFPQPRLRKVDSKGPATVDINQIQPLRYHSRTFSVSHNRQFIEEIAARGQLSRAPLVWANHTDSDSLTLLDGHKRVWAGHVAGLETIQVLGMYLDDETATRVWANRHLGGYTRAERNCAKERLKKSGERIISSFSKNS